MQNQIKSQNQVSSQSSEPTLLNKPMSPQRRPKSTDLSVDEALQKVNIHIQGRTHTKLFRKVVILLIFLICILLGFLLFVNIDSDKVIVESKPNDSGNNFEFIEIHEPSEFDKKILEVDLAEVDAISVLAFNPVTFQIYASKNIEEKRNIASITKLMTAAVALDIYKKEDILTIQEEFPFEVDGGLNLVMGDSMSFDDALKAMLVGSKNDVAMLVAQNHPDGYEAFLEEMNKKAKLLGMNNTNFSNPMGYDDINNYSTAEDLKKLSVYILRNQEILEIVSMPSVDITVEEADGNIEPISILTTNQLLGTSTYMQGLKTGYTKGAGPSFIGYFNASKSDQMITIVLGANEDRFEETLDLFYQVNESYE